jgi:hypothetical protein
LDWLNWSKTILTHHLIISNSIVAIRHNVGKLDLDNAGMDFEFPNGIAVAIS